MTQNQVLENLFAKASRLDKSKQGYLTEDQWDERIKLDGAKRFKRRAMGLCRLSSIKSLEEMAQLLYQTGIASSVEEGREITPSLEGKFVKYADSGILDINLILPLGYLGFKAVINSENQRKYKLYTFSETDLMGGP